MVLRLAAFLAVAVLAVLAFQRWVARPYRIVSASMEPTLHCARGGANCLGSSDDVVVADRVVYAFRAPRRGEIVVARLGAAAAARCGGDRVVVKRVIGLGGETVSEAGGVVSVDGRRLTEPYVDLFHRDHAPARRWRVPAGAYFLMGDNRQSSCDSRTFGAVRRGDLIGQAVAIVWPLSRLRTAL
jgi:signal peptidase I